MQEIKQKKQKRKKTKMKQESKLFLNCAEMQSEQISCQYELMQKQSRLINHKSVTINPLAINHV
jgi:hypothetical protein